jgi:hypothetical protein
MLPFAPHHFPSPSFPLAAGGGAPHGRAARGPPVSSLPVDARLVVAVLKTDARL